MLESVACQSCMWNSQCINSLFGFMHELWYSVVLWKEPTIESNQGKSLLHIFGYQQKHAVM